MGNRIVVTRRCLGSAYGNAGLPPGIEPRTISLDEWLAYVGSNPALSLVKLAANEDESLRAAHPVWLSDRSSSRWLYWIGGEICAEEPDPVLLEAMLQAARTLGARVLTDNEEYVRMPGDIASGTRRGPEVTRCDTPAPLDDEDAAVDRRAKQALLVAGTIVCAASVMWLMQA